MRSGGRKLNRRVGVSWVERMEDRVESTKERKQSWGLFGGLSTWRRDDDAEAGFVLIVVIRRLVLPSSSANDLSTSTVGLIFQKIKYKNRC